MSFKKSRYQTKTTLALSCTTISFFFYLNIILRETRNLNNFILLPITTLTILLIRQTVMNIQASPATYLAIPYIAFGLTSITQYLTSIPPYSTFNDFILMTMIHNSTTKIIRQAVIWLFTIIFSLAAEIVLPKPSPTVIPMEEQDHDR
jgi:tetrahydromethanopterin S-methyltransferase subunit E